MVKKTEWSFKRGVAAILACASLALPLHALADSATSALAGTWTLVAADVEHPDGTRGRDYGAAPSGLLIIDGEGRYSLQIFREERERFSSGDKATGTAAEYKGAVMGSSTHFGTLEVDPAKHILVFHIQHASFPNWEGAQQQRTYGIRGDELSYRVVARPNGDVPISVWKKVN